MLHPHYIEYLYFDLPVVRHGALLLPGVSQLCFSSPTLRTRCQKKKKMKKIKKKTSPQTFAQLHLPSLYPSPALPAAPSSRSNQRLLQGGKTFSEFIAAVPPPPEAQCVFADFLPPWFPVLTVWWERAFFIFIFFIFFAGGRRQCKGLFHRNPLPPPEHAPERLATDKQILYIQYEYIAILMDF